MGIFGTLKMGPPTAQSTLPLPNKTIKRALQFTMRYIEWYYARTFLSQLIIQSTYFTLPFQSCSHLHFLRQRRTPHRSPLHSLETMVFISF